MTANDLLLTQLQALAHPVRLWIIGALQRDGPQYVSALARAAGISRPLLKMHLRKLELAGLVEGQTGTAENGKSANFFRIVPFTLSLTPDAIAAAAIAPPRPSDRPDGDTDD